MEQGLHERLALGALLMIVISMLTFGAMNLLGDPLFNVLGPVAEGTDEESLAKIAAGMLVIDRTTAARAWQKHQRAVQNLLAQPGRKGFSKDARLRRSIMKLRERF